MSDLIHLEAARIPDRNRLLEMLVSHGQDARPIEELGIDVRCKPSRGEAEEQIYADVESTVLALGDPFVPIKHDGVIYLRPPIG
jgi:hypothetical protein